MKGTDDLPNGITKTASHLAAFEVLKSRENISAFFDDDTLDMHFEEKEKVVMRITSVFERIKREESARQQSEQKQALHAAIDSLNLDNIKMAPEMILQQMAEKWGVSLKIKASTRINLDGSTRINLDGSARKKIDKFLIRFLDQHGNVAHCERCIGGKIPDNLNKYLIEQGKIIKDLIIGRLMTGENEGFYTNELSDGTESNLEELEIALESIGKSDKIIVSGP